MNQGPTQFALRQATAEDVPFCFAVQRTTLRVHVIATWGRWHDDDQWRHFTTSFIPARARIILVDGVEAGVLVVDAESDPFRLLSITLLPEFQGRGLGSEVIRFVVAEAGPRPVWLQVLKVNPAITLYGRLGFQVIEETDTHFRMIRPSDAP